MIRYALVCEEEHGFEAWFSSSADYDRQAEAGLVECPHCGSVAVRKQIMAPAVSTSRRKEARQTTLAGSENPGGNTGPPDFQALARKVQAHIRSHYDYVGEGFAREARAIHEGDKPARLIYGETTPAEREKLAEDGVPCAPLPDAFAPTPPKKAN
ncbi:MAG: DUF1178 family protein [Oceanicaulis sp.]